MSANKRIIGIDVSRALAVIGMIIVNFKVVFGDSGSELIKSIVSIFDGKAAATFVVLAGIGLALMTNSALKNDDHAKLSIVRTRIIKRAIFLFVMGLSYMAIWPADILHFYGIYMIIVVLLLKSNARIILFSCFAFIFAYPIAMLLINYDKGWNFDTLEYLDFWTVSGFVRNLFYNGFHPVIPWTAFMLFGYWFGKQNLNDDRYMKKAFWVSTSAFIVIQFLSYASITLLSEGNQETAIELTQILGTSPMPPLPFYMINGTSIAVATISGCIIVAKRFENNVITKALCETGKMALTFYVAHVIIGIGLAEALSSTELGNFSIQFSLIYGVMFSLGCIIFAVIWSRYKSQGPIEWIMRRMTK